MIMFHQKKQMLKKFAKIKMMKKNQNQIAILSITVKNVTMITFFQSDGSSTDTKAAQLALCSLLLLERSEDDVNAFNYLII